MIEAGHNAELERRIRTIGEGIFSRMRSTSFSLFDSRKWSGQMMAWSLRDERFKTQLFRFVDVLPTLRSSGAVIAHLEEYFGGGSSGLPQLLRLLLAVGTHFAPVTSWIVRRNVAAMAGQFITGATAAKALPILRDSANRGAGFTVDILGETVLSEEEAAAYAGRYMELLETLARGTEHWRSGGREQPRVNVSVKISALYSQIHAAAPEAAIDHLKNRLRPLLRRARQLGAFVNLDMESHALKNLTLHLFKSLLDEPEFAACRNVGIVIQAYLKESEADLLDLITWAGSRPRQFTVRLVKGAYWDYERVVAGQRNWEVPVFEQKAQTDANYERLTRLLIENDATICSAFATHNVRSLANVIATAEASGVSSSRYEFQMLYGMVGSIEDALLGMGFHVREYCPIGDLLPGMAYLVRRLLENTSNEGFLRAKFTSRLSAEDLLRNPASMLTTESPSNAPAFSHEPLLDFSKTDVRSAMRTALEAERVHFAKHLPLVIGGTPVFKTTEFASINPANPSEIVGWIAAASTQDANAAVEAAIAASASWSRVPPAHRAALLRKAALIMRRARHELAALEVWEVGKNWQEADADVVEAIDYCNFYADEMMRLESAEVTEETPGEKNTHSYIPRGVGVIIAPWNFPLAILCGMTAAAVVTGNCAIMKPAEQSSVIAFRLMRIFGEAGFPPGVVNLLTGDGEEIGEHLVGHPRVEFIAFTGSKEVGLKILESAGRTKPSQAEVKKVVCEMGGKNALIIDSDADLDDAIAGILYSAFGYQGQKCSALSRLILLEDIHDLVLSRLREAAASLAVGIPSDPSVFIGPLIDKQALERVLRYVEIGKGEATLAFEGTVPDSSGYFCPPIIFSDVRPTARIAREEIFGPVLCVLKAESLDRALMLANDSDFALTGGLYSRSPANIEKVRREFRVGNLYINRPITGAVVKRQPFGGFKMSGTGTKAGGSDYLKQFMLSRVITENVMRHGFAPSEEFRPAE